MSFWHNKFHKEKQRTAETKTRRVRENAQLLLTGVTYGTHLAPNGRKRAISARWDMAATANRGKHAKMSPDGSLTRKSPFLR